MSEDGNRPALRIVSGDPTPAELAAIVAVLSASGGEPDRSEGAAVLSQWSAPARMHRQALPAPNPDAWSQLGTR